jgi:hypothetical protein
MGPEGNDPRLLALCLNTIFPLSGAPYIQTAHPLLNLRDLMPGQARKVARVWDMKSGQAKFTLDHRGELSAVAVSPDGRTVLTASHDGTARLWDTDKGTDRFTLRHGSAVRDAWFIAGGRSFGGRISVNPPPKPTGSMRRASASTAACVKPREVFCRSLPTKPILLQTIGRR